MVVISRGRLAADDIGGAARYTRAIMQSIPRKKPRVGSARSAARLAAVQALYQREMQGDALPKLLTEFHNHRLGKPIGDVEYRAADAAFFDDLVSGVVARAAEIDALIVAHLGQGWALDRLDRPLRQLLRAGIYELIARADVPTATVIDEYVDVANAFYEPKEAGFANGLLDAVAKAVRG